MLKILAALVQVKKLLKFISKLQYKTILVKKYRINVCVCVCVCV